jgi:hypothetical protein
VKGGILLKCAWRSATEGKFQRLPLFFFVSFQPSNGNFCCLLRTRENLGRSLGPGTRGDGARAWCWSGLLGAAALPLWKRIHAELNEHPHSALLSRPVNERLGDVARQRPARRRSY